MLVLIGTGSFQVQVDYREVVQVGYRSVVQVGTGLQWYISQ
jgi:hypothetical protein